MIKALMVVVLMSGAEYSVDMPSMKSCLENAKVVMEQSEMVEVVCIPRADKSAKMKDMFSMFGDMVERLQYNGLGTPSGKCGGSVEIVPFN